MFFLLGASGIVSSLLGTGAVVTVPSGIVSTLLGTGAVVAVPTGIVSSLLGAATVATTIGTTGAVATAGIGAGEVFAVAGAMVSASVIAATTGAVVTEASDRRVPNSEPSENDGISTKSKAAIVGLSSTVGATASYFCCAATCAAVAPAPAFGSKVAAAAGSGFGVTLSAAVSAIPGLLGFTSGGIAKGSIAAWMMSSSAVANGGGVSAGGVVATMQSIGAVGLGTPAIIGICGVAAIVMGSGLAYWSSQKAIAAALATATRYWTSPVVLVGTGAVAGGIVGWIVCVLVDGKFLYRIFDAEKGRT